MCTPNSTNPVLQSNVPYVCPNIRLDYIPKFTELLKCENVNIIQKKPVYMQKSFNKVML